MTNEWSFVLLVRINSINNTSIDTINEREVARATRCHLSKDRGERRSRCRMSPRIKRLVLAAPSQHRRMKTRIEHQLKCSSRTQKWRSYWKKNSESFSCWRACIASSWWFCIFEKESRWSKGLTSTRRQNYEHVFWLPKILLINWVTYKRVALVDFWTHSSTYFQAMYPQLFLLRSTSTVTLLLRVRGYSSTVLCFCTMKGGNQLASEKKVRYENGCSC